jgi:hypothetical protein
MVLSGILLLFTEMFEQLRDLIQKAADISQLLDEHIAEALQWTANAPPSAPQRKVDKDSAVWTPGTADERSFHVCLVHDWQAWGGKLQQMSQVVQSS